MKETTGFDFDHVFEEAAVETLSYLSYIKEKRLRQAAEIRKIKARRKNA